MKKRNKVNSTDFYRGKCLGSPNASYDPVFDFGMQANLNRRSKEICLPPKTEYIVFLVLRKINKKKTRVFNYSLLHFLTGLLKKAYLKNNLPKNFSCASGLKSSIVLGDISAFSI